MSGDARGFNKNETGVSPIPSPPPPLQGKATKEIQAILTETLGEHTPVYPTVKNWVAQFKRGDFSTCDAARPGRPKTVTTPEIIDKIHELILEDRRISAKSIAE
jgi:transposase